MNCKSCHAEGSDAAVLGLLAFAFLLRVVGQVLVAWELVDFPPPMDEWSSGLIPYPILLPIQLVILAVQATISVDLWRGDGLFAGHRPQLGRGLCWFSDVDFAGMVLRYVLTMTFHPDRRWFTGTIPIVFHWVLAGYLFLLGRYYLRADGRHPVSKPEAGRDAT